MIDNATFSIIGRIGRINKRENVTYITIASGYRRREDSGDWSNVTRWNEVTALGDRIRTRISKSGLKVGDLVHFQGTPERTTREKDGKKISEISLILRDFAIYQYKSEATGEAEEQPSSTVDYENPPTDDEG